MIIRKISYLFLNVCMLGLLGLALNTHAQTLEFKANQWQLISFSRLPVNKSISNMFGDAAGNGELESVWTFDNDQKQWQSWPVQNNLPSSDLTEFTVGQGYWIKTTQDITLDLSHATESVGEMALYPGWNLIGFTMEQSITHEQALAGVPYLELWSYDSNRQAFLAVQKSSGSQIILKEEFTDIQPGQGYWVYMAEQSTLQPEMGTLLPADIDVEPLVNITEYGVETDWGTKSPGDIDWDGDNQFDFPNTQKIVAFGDFLNRQYISITNQGNGVLSWQASVRGADAEWLLFETTDENGISSYSRTLSGTASDANGAITLFADRVGRAPGREYDAQLVLSANGTIQEKIIEVSMQVSDIIGDYEVDVKLDTINNQYADLHNPKYFMSLARDSQTDELAAGLKAFLDEERSLLIPKTTYLSGSFVGDPAANFQILGQITQAANDDANPFGKSIRRQITYVGRRSDGKDGLPPLDMKGEYYENIYGVFDDPIQLVGTFTASRLSPIPKKQDNVGDKLYEHEIPAMIGNTPGELNLEIDIDKRLSITEVITAMKIDHPDATALTIKLTAPKQTGAEAGTAVVLHDKENRSIEDLSFEDEDPAVDSLEIYRGQISLGTWKLNIVNRSTSIGHLASWDLSVNGAKVYQVTGTTKPGVRLKITGCGISMFANSDPQTGEFVFDGLIPCDYEISVAQFGYEVTSTRVDIKGCDIECNEFSKYQINLTEENLNELSPQLIASSGEMKVVVSPTSAYLPSNSKHKLKLQAVDVTDYSQLNKTVQSRQWELYKRANTWSAINHHGYLVDVQSSVNQAPPGNNYISYSEDFTKWNSTSRITLSQAAVMDPRGGYSAVKVVHDGSGNAGHIFSSHGLGEGGFPLSKDEFVTFSIFVKKGTNDEIRLRFGDGSTYVTASLFDFLTGTITSSSSMQPTIQTLANNWRRVSVTYRATKDFSNFHCDAWYAKNGTTNAEGESYIYVFGPQCEKHSAEAPIVPIIMDGITIFVPQQNMTGYIPTGANHGIRSKTSSQDVLISRKTSANSENWVYEIDSKPSNAGIYYLKLISDVNTGADLEYVTEDISLMYLDQTDFHLGQFTVTGSAGRAGRNVMDSATFDIDRPEVGDHNPVLDSFYFGSEINPATETNKVDPGMEDKDAPPPTWNTTFNEPKGNPANHFRMHVTTGQLFQTGSMYGAEGRLDVGIQSQEEK